MNPNERTVILRLRRTDVCRLLVLLASAMHTEDLDDYRKVWRLLHSTLKEQLADHDQKWRDKNAV